MDDMMGDLFADLVDSPGSSSPDACANPIGRRRSRRPVARRGRPDTRSLISELRGLLEHQLAGMRRSLRALEQDARRIADRQAVTAEAADHIRTRLAKLERRLDGSGDWQPPTRHSRHRPLG